MTNNEKIKSLKECIFCAQSVLKMKEVTKDDKAKARVRLRSLKAELKQIETNNQTR